MEAKNDNTETTPQWISITFCPQIALEGSRSKEKKIISLPSYEFRHLPLFRTSWSAFALLGKRKSCDAITAKIFLVLGWSRSLWIKLIFKRETWLRRNFPFIHRKTFVRSIDPSLNKTLAFRSRCFWFSEIQYPPSTRKEKKVRKVSFISCLVSNFFSPLLISVLCTFLCVWPDTGSGHAEKCWR